MLLGSVEAEHNGHDAERQRKTQVATRNATGTDLRSMSLATIGLPGSLYQMTLSALNVLHPTF